MQTTTARRIERVPVLAVALLEAEGRLPRLPEVAAQSGPRGATLAEAASLTWLLAYQGEKVLGVASFRDEYDWTTGWEVRRIQHVAGSARASLDLVRWMDADARANGRRCVGSVDRRNTAMRVALVALGAKPSSRVLFEGPS